MTIAAFAKQSETYRGDVGPMFRIAIPAIGFGWRNKHQAAATSRDTQADFQAHFDRDLKSNGNMDPNLTLVERKQVEQLQVIRNALLIH